MASKTCVAHYSVLFQRGKICDDIIESNDDEIGMNHTENKIRFIFLQGINNAISMPSLKT